MVDGYDGSDSYGSIEDDYSDVDSFGSAEASYGSVSSESVGSIDNASFWSIDGYSLEAFLNFQDYGATHWGIVIMLLLGVVSALAYYFVFRKNARYRHLIPSAKPRKASYDRL